MAARNIAAEALEHRVGELLQQVREDASIAGLLCDRHPSNALIYREISADDRCAIITIDKLAQMSRQLAAGLRGLGVRPGDRVATLMGKGVNLVAALLAIWRIGGVHVPLFTAFAEEAVEFRLARSGAKVVFCDDAHRHKVREASGRVIVARDGSRRGDVAFRDLLETAEDGEPASPCNPQTPFIEIYTSGTTGSPKGVVVPAKAIAAFQAYAEFGLDLRPDDLFWNAADPGWGYGLYFGVIATLSTGTPSLVMQGGFDPNRTVEALRRERVTNFAAAPTAYRAMRAVWEGDPLTALRCASSAGEPLPPDLADWAVHILGTPIRDHFGQTEASMIVNNHHHPVLKRELRPGSMGHPAPGWAVRVLKTDALQVAEPGEIGRMAVSIPASPLFWFEGYVGDEAKTREKFAGVGEWYLTGDLGKVDEDGFVYFASRDDDVILMAGYRIGPAEVEAVLERHDAVAECAVIAAPDDLRGEVLEACVVLSPDQVASDELARELQLWVKSQYAAHAYPRRIHWRSGLPRTPSGKVQRFVLRREVAEALQRSTADAD